MSNSGLLFQTPPFFILTGPPGSGKTSLLNALPSQISTVPEYARRVLSAERARNGTATGEQDPAAFIRAMLEMATADYHRAEGLTLFDRGLPDLLAFCAYYHLPENTVLPTIGAFRYRPTAFFLPAWRDIYKTDAERRLDYRGAEQFGTLIRAAYLRSGYGLLEVPKQSVSERAAFVLRHIKDLQKTE
ncbi:MAG: ATP-binding protein [Pseudomonadota bacterium]